MTELKLRLLLLLLLLVAVVVGVVKRVLVGCLFDIIVCELNELVMVTLLCPSVC